MGINSGMLKHSFSETGFCFIVIQVGLTWKWMVVFYSLNREFIGASTNYHNPFSVAAMLV